MLVAGGREPDRGHVYPTGPKTPGRHDEAELRRAEGHRRRRVDRRPGNLAGRRVHARRHVDGHDGDAGGVDPVDHAGDVLTRRVVETDPEQRVDDDVGLAELADLLPGEVDPRAERLADRLLRGEAARVVLRRVRLAVAVGLLRGREAAVAEAVAVPLERPAHTRDLDQVQSEPHQGFASSQSGSWATEETIPSGTTPSSSTSSGRNLPVRTSTVRMPWRCAPRTSPSTSSP